MCTLRTHYCMLGLYLCEKCHLINITNFCEVRIIRLRRSQMPR